MALVQLSDDNLRRELTEYRDRYPVLAEDEVFVLWFLRAFITESENTAASALCGGPNDKGVDAVFVDDAARVVFIVQGKFREVVGSKSETRESVIGFAQVASRVFGPSDEFKRFIQDASPAVAQKLGDVRKRMARKHYKLQMHYVTLGKCSNAIREEAERLARHASPVCSLHLFDGRRILRLLSDYLDGVAPPVPSLDLEIETG